jgi:hypothetical protein
VGDGPLDRVRRICGALPETSERPSHGVPAFFVRGKKVFVMFVQDDHYEGRPAIWCPAPPGVQQDLVDTEPERFFVPQYVGRSGWLGVWLDVDVDWDEIAGIVSESYRSVAPKQLVSQLDRVESPRGKGQL